MKIRILSPTTQPSIHGRWTSASIEDPDEWLQIVLIHQGQLCLLSLSHIAIFGNQNSLACQPATPYNELWTIPTE